MLAGVRHVLTVEAHAISGGLGSFVSGVVASRGLGCRVTSLGVRTSHDGTSGSQRDRWRKHGLDRDSIAAAALVLVANRVRNA
jgi:transketolase C-terminal domain/subunit